MKITHLFAALLLLILFIYLGYGVASLPTLITIVLILGFCFSLLTILNLEVGLYLLIFVVPFTQQLNLGSVRGAPIDIGTDDIFMIFIIISWLANLIRRREAIIIKTPLNWPIMAFFFIAIFSFIGANERFGEGTIFISFLHLFKFFEYTMIYFIVISTIKDLEQIKRFLTMFFIVVGFIMLLQFYAIAKQGFFHVAVTQYGSPAFINLYLATMHAFISNAILGAYYSFFLIILLSIALSMPRAEGKAPLIIFATALSFALFNTYSRSTYTGFFAGFTLLALLLKERRTLLIALALLFFSPIFLQNSVLARITYTIQSVNPLEFDASSNARLVLWRECLDSFMNNPIFGKGYWTTRFVIGAEAHSQYVATLVEVGLIGFSIFIWLLVRILKGSIGLIKKADTAFLKAFANGYTAALAGLLVTCIFSETLEAFRITGPLWFVTGLISSANRILSEKSETSVAG